MNVAECCSFSGIQNQLYGVQAPSFALPTVMLSDRDTHVRCAFPLCMLCLLVEMQ